jgi:hypothetical protein
MEYNYDYNSDMYTNQLYTSGSEVSPETAAATAAIAIGAIVFGLIVFAILYVVFSLLLGKIFKKAGVPSWIAWVPFYNNWKMLEIGGQQGFWAVLAIIPFVNYVALVFMFIAMYHIGKKLQKEGTFVLFAIFLPIVWYIWLAVDKSTWNDSASTAPSLHKPEVTPTASV